MTVRGAAGEELLSSKIERKVREGHECSWKGQALAGITLQHTTVIINNDMTVTFTRSKENSILSYLILLRLKPQPPPG